MNNSFFDPNQNNNNNNQDIDREELAKISPQKRREFTKLFVILITIGLIIGTIVSFALIKVMTKFGLTEKTPQFERIQEN
ncbi:hypothetical protein [Geminocystis herdmanii]|uniref:hypothetical protein n=1 Tax=Geminocystis herdmanii TaxID=669359 RepID=UPI000347C9C5|nr:hypothetical protein [Geminocystis herdmanii]